MKIHFAHQFRINFATISAHICIYHTKFDLHIYSYYWLSLLICMWYSACASPAKDRAAGTTIISRIKVLSSSRDLLPFNYVLRTPAGAIYFK